MLFAATRATAQVGADALPGGRHVGSARAPEARGAALFGVEGAYTESVLGARDHHERASGQAAVGYFVHRALALSAQFGARYDLHQRPSDRGFATSTRLSTRHGLDVGERLSLALGTAFDFPAADGLARGLRAVSPRATLLVTAALGRSFDLSFEAGYRLDRSRFAVAHPFDLSAPDRLAAQIAGHDTVPVGLSAAGRLGAITLWGECSWEPGVGAKAPAASRSPLRVVAGLQRRWDAFLVSAHLGASPGPRPDVARLVRIEPRLWAGVSVGLEFDRPAREAAPAPAPGPTVEAEATPASVRLVLHAVDGRGTPVKGARVSYEQAGASRALTLDQTGSGALEGPTGAAFALRIEAEGFAPLEREVTLDAAGELTLVLERSLPEGEIKGKVRSLRGGPLVARVEVVEAGRGVTSQADGTFRIDVPPGSYTLRITADGHEPQERAVQVEQLGVAILVIDLRRSTP